MNDRINGEATAISQAIKNRVGFPCPDCEERIAIDFDLTLYNSRVNSIRIFCECGHPLEIHIQVEGDQVDDSEVSH